MVAYGAHNGSTPCAEWLRTLKDRQARPHIRVRIARLRLGNLGDYQSVGQGGVELRVDSGPGYRVDSGQDGARFLLLLGGGTKRTHAADIKQARAYGADSLGR